MENNVIEEDDTVQHPDLNGGRNWSAGVIEDGKTLYNLNGEDIWVDLDELTLIEKSNGRFYQEGEEMD